MLHFRHSKGSGPRGSISPSPRGSISPTLERLWSQKPFKAMCIPRWKQLFRIARFPKRLCCPDPQSPNIQIQRTHPKPYLRLHTYRNPIYLVFRYFARIRSSFLFQRKVQQKQRRSPNGRNVVLQEYTRGLGGPSLIGASGPRFRTASCLKQCPKGPSTQIQKTC